jgi:gas vesicle protein
MNLSLQFGNRKSASNGWAAPIEDVKKQIGQQVEHLAEVAGQVSREVAAQAAQATRDAEAKAGAATSAATSAASEVPGAANTLRQRALLGARQLGKDLRSVRITTEPPRSTRPSILPGIALLGGLGAGLALMYFTDPVEGRHRRTLLRGQLTKWTRLGRDKAAATASDVRNRSMELAEEARKTVESKSNDIDSEIGQLRTSAADSTSPDLQGVGPGSGNGWPSPIESNQSTTETTEHQVTSDIR